MKKNSPTITGLIKNNEIFSDIEKSFWLEVFPYFSEKQRNNFYEMLSQESEKYRILRSQQIKRNSDLKDKQILEWRNIIKQENDETSEFVQAKVKERDEEEAQLILDGLKDEK